MPEQVLRIEPEHELKFKGPFNVASTTLLKLSNPSDKRVVFKIKTTAPKRYCVRPNAGLLEPGQSANIAVVFQPCELEPTANKHKFMVQALYAADGDVNMDALWKDVDNTKLMDTKLRCTFEMPADSGNQNDLNATEDVKLTRAKNEEVLATKAHKASDDNRGVGDASGRIQAEALRQENLHLQNELDKLKRQFKSRENSGMTGMTMQSNVSPPAVPMVYIVLALVAVLVGLIMGKFIL